MPKKTFFNLDENKQNRIVDCALDEFSERSFENSNLSNIIKNAKISRGSLYQYFEDKKDIYLYIMNVAVTKKLSYIQEYFSNPMDLPFLELFKSMYLAGVKFAIDNPRLVRMMSHLLISKGEIYNEVFKNNIEVALELYSTLIDRDKEQGRIRNDIDTRVLAQLVVDITTNISIKEVESNEGKFNFDNMIERITQVLKIFEKGVVSGE